MPDCDVFGSCGSKISPRHHRSTTAGMRRLRGCCVWVSPNMVLNIVPKVFLVCSDATFYITVACDLESSLNYAPIRLDCWTLYFTHLFSLTMCLYTTLLLIWLLYIFHSLSLYCFSPLTSKQSQQMTVPP